jgi:nucleoside-diphosphate-sugar epimerase
MRTLVVGGTGPTGPFIVNGLRERGREVTIFHRGTHEIPEIPPDVRHIHGDPHFAETIAAATAGETFDEVIATYGRIRLIAEAFAGKVGRFISVGGVAVYRGFGNARLVKPVGVTAPVREDAPVADDEAEERFGMLIAQTEDVVFANHPTATVFRYPYVYGPYQLVPREWSIVRRVLDGRRHILLPDGGTTLSTHGWAGNLAHALLLAVDQPEASAGKAYNCGDLDQLSIRQDVEVVAGALGATLEPVSVPWEVAGPAKVLALSGRQHRLMDLARVCGDLGYRDVLPAPEAIARTARWYAENPADADLEQRLGDPFDYAWEDRMIDAAGAAMACWEGARRGNGSDGELARSESGRRFRPHPYAHPKEAGVGRDHRGR